MTQRHPACGRLLGGLDGSWVLSYGGMAILPGLIGVFIGAPRDGPRFRDGCVSMSAAILGTGFAVTQYRSLTERLFGLTAVPARSLPLLSPVGMFTRLSKSGQPVWPGRPGRVTEDINHPAGWPGPHGSWQVTGWFTGPSGQRLSSRAAQAMLNRIPVPVATTPSRLRTWLASRDIAYWIGSQPASRYWLFQAAAAVILITLAAAAGLLAVRLASRRT